MSRTTAGAISRGDGTAQLPSTETHHSATDAVRAPAAGIGVLEKAMNLLNIVSARRMPMTFTELLRACDLPKATLHRILTTLVREGLLRHNAYDKTFQLGLRLLELAHDVWSEFDLRVAAQDELARLRDALGETVELTVLDGKWVVILASEPGDEASSARSAVGQRLPVHASAAGKAIAANLDVSGQRRLIQALDLEGFTKHTIVTPAALQAEFELVRARGYAIEQGERASDRAGVAAPIFDYEGRPIGAVAITTDVSRLDGYVPCHPDAPRIHLVRGGTLRERGAFAAWRRTDMVAPRQCALLGRHPHAVGASLRPRDRRGHRDAARNDGKPGCAQGQRRAAGRDAGGHHGARSHHASADRLLSP